ncbi:ABC transporter permease [Nocardioides sp. YIM 152315]|uniref:ABC transporter permease n=1 Tax=Nocardioides sp. YIM 152315 TaxID=3031760 RepID=UPI0023DA73C9|nr:ABC transporter permease [Nocardioides sp. YIM 152315]MDF1605996.1 ABC transporter permease [Nocardioides sp. YIM 152315]
MNAIMRSSRAELLRLRRWPAVWVTLGAWVALALMFGYVFGYLAYKTGDNSFANEGESMSSVLQELLPVSVPDVLLQGMPMFGGALMMVLGAMVAGSGYGWGTWKTVFTQGPSRTASVLGSLVATTVYVVGTVLFTLVLYVGVSLAIALSEGQDVVWPSAGSVLESVLAGLLVLEMWALAGFALGTLSRGPALSVGLGLVWALVVENLLRGVGNLLGAIEALTHVLPGTAAGSLVGSLIGVDAGGGTPGVVDAISGTQATWTVLAYVVALPVLSLVLVRRRDVS